MKSPRVWYVNVFVNDLERAVDFYQNSLGMPLVLRDDQFGYASFESAGIRLGVAQVDPDAENAPSLVARHTGIGFGVSDLDAAYAELRAKGVEFTMPPTRQPWGGTMAMLQDPDGNVFYLDQLRDE